MNLLETAYDLRKQKHTLLAKHLSTEELIEFRVLEETIRQLEEILGSRLLTRSEADK